MFSFSVPAGTCSYLNTVIGSCDLMLSILFPSSNFSQSSGMILNVLLSLQWACGQPSIIYKCHKHVNANTNMEQPWTAALLEAFPCFMVCKQLCSTIADEMPSDCKVLTLAAFAGSFSACDTPQSRVHRAFKVK